MQNASLEEMDVMDAECFFGGDNCSAEAKRL